MESYLADLYKLLEIRLGLPKLDLDLIMHLTSLNSSPTIKYTLMIFTYTYTDTHGCYTRKYIHTGGANELAKPSSCLISPYLT